MSNENQNQNNGQVLDEENRVDKRLKDRILDARERVAKREDDIFVGAPLDEEIDYTHDQLVAMWSTTVRQFLRTIEPLLKSEEIENSHYYYREIPILERELRPPDGETPVVITGGGDGVETETKKIHWSLLFREDYDSYKFMRDTEYFSPGFEPPEPKQVSLLGLKSIIEQDGISAGWDIVLNPDDPPVKKTYIAKPRINHSLSKKTLEYAVRKADEFLHNAGIGLEIGDPTKEAKADYADVVNVPLMEETDHV